MDAREKLIRGCRWSLKRASQAVGDALEGPVERDTRRRAELLELAIEIRREAQGLKAALREVTEGGEP